MNRISETFKRLKKEKKKAFIPYVTAGDPNITTTRKIVDCLAGSGADIIELGIPFSDPLADGPVIQRAIQRSLTRGCSVKKVFDMVAVLRNRVQTPIVFMTYYNIIFNYGPGRFVEDAKASGADGVIVPDLPLEESDELAQEARKRDFYLIMLAAPTTPAERFKKIAERSDGFIYYVSLTGVTGARRELSGKLKSDVKKLKALTRKPVCVGFGVSDPAQAKDVVIAADGVIVGSAIINVIENDLADKDALVAKVKAFSSSIAKAVHGV